MSNAYEECSHKGDQRRNLNSSEVSGKCPRGRAVGAELEKEEKELNTQRCMRVGVCAQMCKEASLCRWAYLRQEKVKGTWYIWEIMGYLLAAPGDPGWPSWGMAWSSTKPGRAGEMGPHGCRAWVVKGVARAAACFRICWIGTGHCRWDNHLGEAVREWSAAGSENRTGGSKGDCEDSICTNQASVQVAWLREARCWSERLRQFTWVTESGV